jgi:hypothetical protein
LLDRGLDFFDGAHGRQYTGLGNHRQRFFFGLTAAFSRSQPTDSQLRRTSSRFCCKALLAIFALLGDEDNRIGQGCS